jgi:hypothetical protein
MPPARRGGRHGPRAPDGGPARHALMCANRPAGTVRLTP